MNRLSVVVTVVDGGAALSRCLAALSAQSDAAGTEVLVPYDSSCAGVAELAARFPAACFLALGTLASRRAPSTPSGLHELIDRRRSAGLAAAAGEIVAMVEDRGVPRSDWAAGVLAEHARLPHAVIGGPIEVARDGVLARAVFACDFGRYQPPLAPGPRAFVSDVNVSYKRRALEATRELWRERYQETIVHWALAAAGETLWLSDRFVVDQQRDGLRVAPLLAERFAAGRFFAATRARSAGPGGRLVRALAMPVLPFVLLARHLGERRRAGRRRSPFGTAAAVALLVCATACGELAGELTGRD